MEIDRKFLKNDLVKVIGKEGILHSFNIGDRAKLIKRDSDNSWFTKNIDNEEKDNQWILAEDMELCFQEGDLVKVRKYEDLCGEFEADSDGDFYFDSTGDYETEWNIRNMNKYDLVLKVLRINEDGYVELKDKDREEYILAPEVLEFVEEQPQIKEEKVDDDEIRVGSIVKGISNFYTYTNTYMTEALVRQVRGDAIDIQVLKHEKAYEDRDIKRIIEKGNVFSSLPKEHFELVREGEIIQIEEKSVETKTESPYIPFKVTITSDGKTTNCTYEEYGKVKEVQAKLHPDDKFDFKTGVDLCIERAFDFSIKEGDIVEVIDEGKIYPTYTDWLVANKIPVEIASRFCYGADTIPLYKEYEVIKKGLHGCTVEDVQLFLIKDTHGDKVFLISENGIRKVED